MFSSNINVSKLSLTDKIFSMDYILLITILIIGVISCFAMYSTDRGVVDYYTISHISRFGIFFILFILFSLIRINFWHSLSYFFYFLVLALLLYVDFFGLTASGSKRWISLYFINLQPSEIMKIAIILFLAKYYHRISPENVNNLRYMILPLFATAAPVYLVVNQPDLGTSLLIAATGFGVIWLAGVRIRYFTYMVVMFVATAPFIIAFLKPYQKQRILTFFNPDRDPLGAGYQIIQSKIAIGSGGIWGKGFLKGSQSYLDYLPEKHTDFIFTLFSEEFGFIGSLILLLLYVVLILRIMKIAANSRSSFAKYFCYGFALALFIYISINMSMVLGLLPIVGSPLPIMSYGGSSMLSVMVGFGIVMSCKIHSNSVVL